MNTPIRSSVLLFSRCQSVRMGASLVLLASIISGCSSVQSPPMRTGQVETTQPQTPTTPPPQSVADSPIVRQLMAEADTLSSMAQSDLAKNFLRATRSLPAVGVRKAWQRPNNQTYVAQSKYAEIAEIERNKLVVVELDEYRYYYTKYGSPLGYMRLLEVAANNGVPDVANKKILDFGYGGIGHMRLLASLGAQMVGVDVDSYLEALYDETGDTGRIAPAATARNRSQYGSINLINGAYPKDATITAEVGGGYDLIISKNTLKRGYIKPERKVDKKFLVNLGVSDEVFLSTLFAALKPGGRVIIYNLQPKQGEEKQPYKPHADGRCPYSSAQFEAAGFRVITIDANDDIAIREMGRRLGWDRNEAGEVISDLDKNLFASYSVVQRP
jgi:hypothetical protein